MEKLDHAMLSQVKKGFVAMPGGADPSMGAGPVAGGGMMTQAQASPMGGTPQMDPSMGGGMPPGGDPSMGGGQPPMDPSMMGAAPGGDPNAGGMPPGGDPNAGMPPAPPADAGAGAAPSGQIVLTPDEFIAIIQVLQGGGGGGAGKAPGAKGGGKAGTDAKLDQILQALGGGQPQQPPQQ